MTVSARLLALSIVVAVPCAAPTAFADAPSAATKKNAEARFKKGLAFYDAGDFDRALEEFLAAYALVETPALLRNIALSELYSNRPVEALRHFEEYLATPDLSPQKRTETQQYVDQAFARTGHLRIAAADDVAIIAGERTYRSPLKELVHVDAGTVTVTARGGGREISKTVEAPAGAVVDVDLTFPSSAAGDTTAGGAASPPAFTAPPTSDDPPTDRTWSTGRIATAASFGAAAIGSAVVGFVFYGKASSAASDARTLLSPVGGCVGVTSPECARAGELERDHDDAMLASRISFLAGGALLATGALLTLVFWPKSKTTAFSPAVSPTAVGGDLRLIF
jgi:tetratricopeptide (TPR) repeat protein